MEQGTILSSPYTGEFPVLGWKASELGSKEGGGKGNEQERNLPAKSILPVSISARMQPAAHMSMALV